MPRMPLHSSQSPSGEGVHTFKASLKCRKRYRLFVITTIIAAARRRRGRKFEGDILHERPTVALEEDAPLLGLLRVPACTRRACAHARTLFSSSFSFYCTLASRSLHPAPHDPVRAFTAGRDFSSLSLSLSLSLALSPHPLAPPPAHPLPVSVGR
jgi:hypothetical protein